jgi:hypothetical protein
MGVRAYQGGATMRKLASVLVLLVVVSPGRADDKGIVERLDKAGVPVGPYDGNNEWFTVHLDSTTFVVALQDLCELKGLRALCVTNSELTEAQIRTICALPLIDLLLIDCPVTDAQLKQLVRLRGLKMLALVGSRVTDAGLKDLAELGNLEGLILNRTAVTEVGLRHLERVKSLRTLFLFDCPGVTYESIARLKKALPNCRIDR